jgi:hypothetical protein
MTGERAVGDHDGLAVSVCSAVDPSDRRVARDVPLAAGPRVGTMVLLGRGSVRLPRHEQNDMGGAVEHQSLSVSFALHPAARRA